MATSLVIEESLATGGRIQKLVARFNDAAPSVCIERALAFTASHEATEGLPLIVRRAKAFREVCERIPVVIFDDELVVGSPGAVQRPGSLCPEISWKWLRDELDTIGSRAGDPYGLTEEQKELLERKVFPYWTGRSVEEIVLSRLPAETRRLGVDSGIVDSEIKWRSGVAEITPEYEDVIFKKGFAGIKRQAEAYLEEVRFQPTDQAQLEKSHFYEAIVEVCEGLVALGHRYAERAAEMALEPTGGARRRELLEIGAICEWVPENPPRTFREALQMVWFVQMACALAENGPGFNLGRFDQYMYPYYEADIDSGEVTRESAQELLECLWIKLSEWVWLLPANGARYYGGYNSFQNLTVGGRKKDGSDATNELSYMCLQATEDVRLPQPALSVRVHSATPERFMRAACELSRLGTGFPAFHNDTIGMQMMMYAGLPPEEARDWSLLGCVVPHHRKVGEWTDAGALNIAAAIELALNDGCSRLTGEQMGVQTGDPTGFDTFEEFKDAFLRQLRFLMKQAVITTTVEEQVHRETMPRPYISAIVDGCLEKGTDISRGGARYNVGPGWVIVGTADTANSLAAVEKLVYDEKKVSMAALCDALDRDFDGDEELRQLLINSPKFGNDDDSVDRFAVEITDFIDQEFRSYRDCLGLPFHGAAMGLTNNLPTGGVLGALPSGRRARVPLAEGCSPHSGTDISGPTSCMRSVAKVNHENLPGGTLLNIKFAPTVLEGDKGISDLSALIRGYFDLGGYHCQFNVIDAETLRDAQAHPERHRGLIIRVAGYSARFVTLSREVQDEIIKRTTHMAI